MELGRKGGVYHVQRVEGGQEAAKRKTRQEVEGKRNQQPSFACGNQNVVQITNRFVSDIHQLMWEFRRLNMALSELNVQVRAEWLPFSIKKYVDALSRPFPREDLLIRRQIQRSVAHGMKDLIDAFKYRPLREHPFIRRKLMIEELMKDWNDGKDRLL